MTLCRRGLASRPEVIDSLHMRNPVQESQGQVEASAIGGLAAAACCLSVHLLQIRHDILASHLVLLAAGGWGSRGMMEGGGEGAAT